MKKNTQEKVGHNRRPQQQTYCWRSEVAHGLPTWNMICVLFCSNGFSEGIWSFGGNWENVISFFFLSQTSILNILNNSLQEKKHIGKNIMNTYQKKTWHKQHRPHPHQFTGLELFLRNLTQYQHPTPIKILHCNLGNYISFKKISYCLYPATSQRYPHYSMGNSGP